MFFIITIVSRDHKEHGAAVRLAGVDVLPLANLVSTFSVSMC